MRVDTRALFDRLKIKTFVYEEFADTLSDTELWPIFEVTLNDVRIVGSQHVSPHGSEPVSDQYMAGQARTGSHTPVLPERRPASLSVVTPGGLFHNYGSAENASERPEQQTSDRGNSVRAILGRLSRGVE